MGTKTTKKEMKKNVNRATNVNGKFLNVSKIRLNKQLDHWVLPFVNLQFVRCHRSLCSTKKPLECFQISVNCLPNVQSIVIHTTKRKTFNERTNFNNRHQEVYSIDVFILMYNISTENKQKGRQFQYAFITIDDC